MTQAAQGDKVTLATAGVSVASAAWRGGVGQLVVTGPASTPDFEFQADDGTWLDVKELGTGAAITAIAAAGAWLFCLPASRIRLSAGSGAMNAYAVGI